MSVFRRLWNTLRPRRLDRELDDELEFHYQMRRRRARERGLDPEEAEIDTRRRMGSLPVAVEGMRDAHVVGWLAVALQDLRHAVTLLRRDARVSALIILVLALGIGGNTAIFTLMDQLMLRELPIDDPDSLVMLYQQGAHNGPNMGVRVHSYPLYLDFKEKAEPLADVLCRRLVLTSVSIGGRNEWVDAEMVSGNFFTMLGVKPAAGRLFGPGEDDGIPDSHPVVVLTYDYWATRFARDPAIIGSKILVNNHPMTVIGVSARGFAGLDPAQSPQLRVPVLMKSAVLPEQDWLDVFDRHSRWVQVFARLKPDYTAKTAQAPLQVLFHQIREYESTLESARDWSPDSRDRFLEGTIQVENAATGYSDLRNSFSTALVVLMSMVGLVLLIACANVANLLIARALARQKEIAVRLSIGATRGRLVGQLLAESLMLSFLGGAAGVGVAFALTRGLLALVPSEGDPILIRPEPDLRILLFTLVLTVLTGLVFGLVPALRASRPDLSTTLKDNVGAIAGGGGSLLLRKSLVVGQVALSFLLLFGAGLFARSLHNLKQTDSGFRDTGNLVTFMLAPAFNGYDTPGVERFYEELLERVRALPGVTSAAYSSNPVLHGPEWTWDETVRVEGGEAGGGENAHAFMNALSPGYFETMGVPILEGRDLNRRDMQGHARVAIVSRQFAENYFGDGSAVGRHLGLEGDLDTEIIGVSGDSLYEGPRDGVRRQVFIPHSGNGSVAFYVRTAMAPDAAYSALRNAVKELDPSMPLFDMKTLARQLDETLLTERLTALLSVGFGALATLLASIGLYGVMAFAVARRTKEIGLRMALGAQPGAVTGLVMREVLLLVATGFVFGVPAALALGRFVSSQLYGIEAADPVVAIAAMVVMIAISTAAGFIPARRASRISPILALRYE